MFEATLRGNDHPGRVVDAMLNACLQSSVQKRNSQTVISAG